MQNIEILLTGCKLSVKSTDIQIYTITYERQKHMIVRLKYACSPYISIKMMSVIGSFNAFDPKKGIMELKNGCWVTKIDLPPGDHRYKFLINGVIKLNDPAANIYLPDDLDELWSAIIIDDQEQRRYNNQRYTVNIRDYCLTSSVTDKPVLQKKCKFNPLMDKKVVARFEFDQITGLHAVTAVWCDQYGRVFEYAENNLYAESLDPVFLWFWIDIDNFDRKFTEGFYKLKFFIDGGYVLEDEITISCESTYSNGYRFLKSY